MFGLEILLLLAASAYSFYGQQQSAKAQEQAGKMQQDAAEKDARNQELQNSENVQRERVNKRRALARMRAEISGSGSLMDQSTMDAFTEQAGQMELTIQDAARAGSMDAANTRSQGNMQRWEAQAQATSDRIKSYGTLLQGGASAYSSAYNPKTTV